MRTSLRLITFALVGLFSLASVTSSVLAQDEIESFDIIWMLDESTGMTANLGLIQNNIDAFIATLPQDKVVRLGLVGFGIIPEHSGTEETGFAHTHLALTNDIDAFRVSLTEITSDGTPSNPHNAILHALADEMAINSNARLCPILVTEQSVINAPTNDLDAAAAALSEHDAVLISILGNQSFEEVQNTKAVGVSQSPVELKDYVPSTWLNMNFLSADPVETLSSLFEHCASGLVTTTATASQVDDEMTALLAPTVQELVQIVQDHETRLSDLEIQVGNIISTSAGNTGDTSGLEGLVQKHEADIIVLQQNFGTLADLLAAVPQLNQLTADISTNAASISNNSASLGELSAALSGLEQTSSDLTSRIEQLETATSVIADIQNQQRGFASELSQFSARVATNEINLSNLPIAVLDSRISTLEQTTAQIAENRADIDANGATIGALEARVSETEALLVRLPIEDHRQRIESLESVTAILPPLSGDVQSLNTTLSQLQQRVTALDAGMRALPVQDNSDRIAALESDVSTMQNEQSLQDQKASDIEGSIQDARSRISVAAREIETLKGKHASDTERLSNRVSNTETMSNSLRSATERNQNGVEELRIRLDTLSESLTLVEAQANRFASELEALGLQMRDADRKIDGVEATLGDRIEDLESNIRLLRGDLERLQSLTSNLPEDEDHIRDLLLSQDLQDGALTRFDQRLSRTEDRLEALNEIFLGLNDETRQSVLELLQEKFDQHDREIQSLNTYMFILAGALVGTILLLVMQIV